MGDLSGPPFEGTFPAYPRGSPRHNGALLAGRMLLEIRRLVKRRRPARNGTALLLVLLLTAVMSAVTLHVQSYGVIALRGARLALARAELRTAAEDAVWSALRTPGKENRAAGGDRPDGAGVAVRMERTQATVLPAPWREEWTGPKSALYVVTAEATRDDMRQTVRSVVAFDTGGTGRVLASFAVLDVRPF